MKWIFGLAVWVCFFGVGGCSDDLGSGESATDGDADGDADGDVDGDTDSDADTDADSDSDANADIDGDTDGDSDTDGDTDSDADTDSDMDTDGDTDDDTDTDTTPAQCEASLDGLSLVWFDEFDYDGLPDPARWGYEVGGGGWGNGEAQFYTDGRLENVSVNAGNGLMTITARKENWDTNEYTSAKINSSYGASNPGSWNEGIIEIRGRLPGGVGTWPAFWMMPDDCAEGWPNCGEIDIMEHVGYDEGRIHGTIHTDAFNHIEGTQIGGNTMVPTATSAFHTYTLRWTADQMQWSVDGVVYHTINKEAGWEFAEWPFDEKTFHLKINIAIGGAWGGVEGIDDSIFPVTMDLDYVCVYQNE